ncbi:MAG: 50S ribosomal protein L23 [Clostridia bacterium]|nr:50S ribosomal protein L23 [Clostridia bacterium]
MTPEDIILKPVLTEKATDGLQPGEKSDRTAYGKKYTFIVAKSANKTQIKIAIEKMFEVKVQSVNTVTRRGKLKRMGRNEGYTPTTKKAIVQLKEDSKPIEFFEVMQ